MSTVHTMKLSEPWYTLVKNGNKTVEGRINDEKRQKLKIGDTIIFTDTSGKNSFQKRIKNLKTFKTFDSAIREAKLKNILPGIRTYKKGVDVYLSIKGFKEKENKYGVLLIYLEKF